MNELTVSSTHLVALHTGETIPISQERRDNLARVLQMPTPPKYIEIDGDIYQTTQIKALLRNETSVGLLREKDMAHHRAMNEWRCPAGLWHSRQFKDCSCRSSGKSYRDSKTKQMATCPYCPQLDRHDPGYFEKIRGL
jgi:hypothetical protein